jgi:hypothetical protein
MEKELVLSDELLEGFGTHSLIGYVWVPELKKLRLVFPRSTQAFCERNGGPRELILYEYNIPCLLEDVIWLLGKGVEISIEYRIV